MILRVSAGLSLALGVSLFLAYLGEVGKAPWSSTAMRHLREMKERLTTPDAYTPLTHDEFAALPSALPLAEYARIERRGASVEGYVQLMGRVIDADYGLLVVPGFTGTIMNDTLPVITELTYAWRRGSESWRMDRLAPQLRPHDWGMPPWPAGPRRARISGWLLYDFPHDPLTRRHSGTKDLLARRLTGWELHPVTRIELWDDSLAAFVDWPR